MDNEFDSSFDTLAEANLRVEYVFYYANPWYREKYDMYADRDEKLAGGFRYLESSSDDPGSLIVSAMPSKAFDSAKDPSGAQHDEHDDVIGFHDASWGLGVSSC